MAGRKGRMGVKFELLGVAAHLRRGRKVVEPVGIDSGSRTPPPSSQTGGWTPVQSIDIPESRDAYAPTSTGKGMMIDHLRVLRLSCRHHAGHR